MRHHPLSILLLFAACTTAPVEERSVPIPALPTGAGEPAVTLEPQDEQRDTLSAAATQVPKETGRQATKPSTDDLGCTGYTSYRDERAQVTSYVPRKELQARMAELHVMLPGLYAFAMDAAPRSIADDFENGISTTHIHMPDTLPVAIAVYADCRAKEAYTTLHFRVWKAGNGGYAWDGE